MLLPSLLSLLLVILLLLFLLFLANVDEDGLVAVCFSLTSFNVAAYVGLSIFVLLLAVALVAVAVVSWVEEEVDVVRASVAKKRAATGAGTRLRMARAARRLMRRCSCGDGVGRAGPRALLGKMVWRRVRRRGEIKEGWKMYCFRVSCRKLEECCC